MSEKEQPYVIVERHGAGFAAFVWGAAVGAALALLFAPKSGQQTQEDLREGARRLREGAEEKLTELRDGIETGYERTREEVNERVSAAREDLRERQRRAEEDLKAGKEAAKKARTDLETRVAESKRAYKAALAETDGSPEVNGDVAPE